MQTEKSQPKGKWIMPKTRFTEFWQYQLTRGLGFLGLHQRRGWSGSAMVLGKLPVPGRPTIWMKVGQGPIAIAVGADWDCLDIFLSPIFSLLSPSL